MPKPREMDVVRRAYELWQQAGEPSGKDEEFYYQAKRELQSALNDGSSPTADEEETATDVARTAPEGTVRNNGRSDQ